MLGIAESLQGISFELRGELVDARCSDIFFRIACKGDSLIIPHLLWLAR
jgi:hypothetical protein